MKHSLERTNPKGVKGIFVCALCGKPDLPATAALLDCENVRGLTQDQALVEAILGPGHAGADEDMPPEGYSAARPTPAAEGDAPTAPQPRSTNE